MHDYARELRNNVTPAEKHLWSRLRRRQLTGLKFRRQHTVGRYVCDFVCLEAGLPSSSTAANTSEMRHATLIAMHS